MGSWRVAIPSEAIIKQAMANFFIKVTTDTHDSILIACRHTASKKPAKSIMLAKVKPRRALLFKVSIQLGNDQSLCNIDGIVSIDSSESQNNQDNRG